MRCLLIELKDNRKFMTYQKNFNQLIEFCKSFKANMSLVNMKNGIIFDLEELVPALCNPKQKKVNYEYTIIENKMITTPKNKKQIALKLRDEIRRKFEGRQTISEDRLCKKYAEIGLSKAAIKNSIRYVKDEMKKEGHSFCRVSPGVYKIK